ncbi:hypothetical protein ACV07N_00070 [Roseivirga echinicomitans]
MKDFLEPNWPYLVALFTFIAYLLEKGYSLWIDKKKKQLAYNRVLTAIVRLQFSYLRYRKLYSEKSFIKISDKDYAPIVKQLNSFNSDIDEFQKSIIKETEIIPDVSIGIYLFFDSLDQLRLIDKLRIVGDREINGYNDQSELIIKRAQLYALEGVLEKFFNNILSELESHSSINRKTIEKLKHANSTEFQTEYEKEIAPLLVRYFESLYRQGAITEDMYKEFIS